MIGRVGPSDAAWDPREDPRDPRDYPFPDEDDEGWVSSEAIGEILTFELMTSVRDPECPRCAAAAFTYGRIRFCSRGCPENLLVVEKPARLE